MQVRLVKQPGTVPTVVGPNEYVEGKVLDEGEVVMQFSNCKVGIDMFVVRGRKGTWLYYCDSDEHCDVHLCKSERSLRRQLRRHFAEVAEALAYYARPEEV